MPDKKQPDINDALSAITGILGLIAPATVKPSPLQSGISSILEGVVQLSKAANEKKPEPPQAERFEAAKDDIVGRRSATSPSPVGLHDFIRDKKAEPNFEVHGSATTSTSDAHSKSSGSVVIDGEHFAVPAGTDIAIAGDRIVIGNQEFKTSPVDGVIEIKIIGDVRIGTLVTNASVNVDGSINGEVTTSASVNAGSINGDVTAEGDIQCGNVNGDAEIGGNVQGSIEVKGNLQIRK